MWEAEYPTSRPREDDNRHLNKVGHHSGNFQAFLQFRVDAGDNVLREHFVTASSYVTYSSKTTQNELISLCSDYIRDQILAEVRDAGFYSICADEATYQANHEQLTLVLRFCDKNYDIFVRNSWN